MDNFGTSNQVALDEYFVDIDEGTYDYLSFELLDPNGVVYYAYPHNTAVLGIDRSNEEFVEAASNLDTLYWSRPYVSLYSEELTISITTKNQDFYVIAYMPLTYINDLYIDQKGSIWASQNTGISRIEFPSAFSLFNKQSGIDGNVNSILRFEGRLYVATDKGVYMLQPNERIATNATIFIVNNFFIFFTFSG